MSDHLERVRQAHFYREEVHDVYMGEARDAYIAAIVAAKDAGETITAIAAAAGVSRPTLYKILAELDDCPTCNGTGMNLDGADCPACDGTGTKLLRNESE